MRAPTFWAVALTEAVFVPLTCLRRMKGMSYISSVTSFSHIVFLLVIVLYLFFTEEPLALSEMPLLTGDLHALLEVYTLC